MIDLIVSFGLGIVVGASIMLVIIVISLEREMRPRKKPPTKDEWRMM